MNDLQDRILDALRTGGHHDLVDAFATAMPAVAAYARNGDTILYDNEWLQMRETPDGYVYSHEAKSDGKGVAVLAYRHVGGSTVQVAGRYERTPCHHDGLALTSLTGLVDREGEDPVDTAVRELWEEAGIRADASQMRPLGTVRPSKQADTTMYLFAINVGDRDIGPATGDGTSGEADAYCKWVSVAEACLSKSPVLAALLVRAFPVVLVDR